MHYDVFNGDADGIIALLQLRLDAPKDSILVTGVKRDIKLLSQVVKAGDATSVTTLDISMEKNQDALHSLLDSKVPVFYCDHHRTGDIPESDSLDVLVNLDAEVCTSLLINQKLQGKYSSWAIAAAFGDNLNQRAQAMGEQQGLNQTDIDFLCELGTLINYNGYGASLDDLHIPPAELFLQLKRYPSPFELREDKSSPYYQLKVGYEQDYANVAQIEPVHSDSVSRVFELPCERWARRISGVYGNELANQSPELAHAVMTLNSNGEDYTVSVRAPLRNRVGADDVCTQFATGGGRKAAAGINALPVSEKAKFIQTLNDYYRV
ncbi:DHH family phosphoesterase [Vibrio viridaestus]|uniref:DHH family phosphoesterase n=1 Tax=Vibrio viridaestus TaxID=2487322 RepID=A0A3N9TCX7_9VIBR|nr:DHH family phosphoesterase [Vibrio viridaestus]RQW61704.1 DHH family phosphoesterase [Vibrio viridaestus]